MDIEESAEYDVDHFAAVLADLGEISSEFTQTYVKLGIQFLIRNKYLLDIHSFMSSRTYYLSILFNYLAKTSLLLLIKKQSRNWWRPQHLRRLKLSLKRRSTMIYNPWFLTIRHRCKISMITLAIILRKMMIDPQCPQSKHWYSSKNFFAETLLWFFT